MAKKERHQQSRRKTTGKLPSAKKQRRENEEEVYPIPDLLRTFTACFKIAEMREEDQIEVLDQKKDQREDKMSFPLLSRTFVWKTV